ncbi:MAG: guanylate kinase [Proteobacteria bacterium]|nr:guanylate kinase [Pseudomonadota bacterium]
MEKKGRLFVVSAPSGAGKTTLIQRVLERFPKLSYSISHTTRKPRKGEIHGKDYFFIDEVAFQLKVEQDQWMEWAKVHGNFYGTSKAFVTQKLMQGDSLVLDIDVQGAKQIMASKLSPVSIFIMPPSIETLRQRLENRGTDSGAVILQRMENAQWEMSQRSAYDHVVVNGDIHKATFELCTLFENEMRSL